MSILGSAAISAIVTITRWIDVMDNRDNRIKISIPIPWTNERVVFIARGYFAIAVTIITPVVSLTICAISGVF